MKVVGLHAKNFLSFKDFHLLDLDEKLNFLVGSNGSGKSNVLEIIKVLVKTVLSMPNNNIYEYDNVKLKENWYEISMDLRFDEQDEYEMFVEFIRACLATDQAVDTLRQEYEFSQMMDNLDSIKSVDKRTLKKFYFDFLIQNINCKSLNEFFKGRITLRVSLGVRKSYLLYYTITSEEKTINLIIGQSPSSVVTVKTPEKALDSYNSSDLGAKFVSQIKLAEYLKNGVTNKDCQSIFCIVHRMLEESSFLNLAGNISFDEDFTYKLTNSLHPNRIIDLSLLFKHLFKSCFFFLENIRSKQLKSFTKDELTDPSLELGNGEKLALYLFKLKNGSKIQWNQYKLFEDLFFKLANEHIDLRLLSESVVVQEDSSLSTVTIELVIRNSIYNRDILLENSGAGLLEMALISALLTQPSAKILLLDEPGSNVFPAKQRKLMSELHNVKSQSLIITHSPFLIPPDNIINVRRIYKMEGTSYVTESYEPKNFKQHSKLLQVVSRTTDSLSLLFYSCVILVEGDSESYALPIWFQKYLTKENKTLDDFNIKIFAVNGYKSFQEYVSFLDTFNVPWLLLYDGDAKDFILQKFDSIDFASKIFARGSNDDDNFETLPEVVELSNEARTAVGNSKPRQAQYIAENTDCPDEFKALFQKAIDIVEKQNK